ELKEEHNFEGEEIDHLDIKIFDVAYNIIGGGEEGDKTVVRTKEEADHSLQYMLAVAILDNQVMPEQYRIERIQRQDVQELLKKISVHPLEAFSRRFPDEMPCYMTLSLRDGRSFFIEKKDYEGFHTRPIPWERIVKKFEQLSRPYADQSLRSEIIEAVGNLENIRVTDLMKLLAKVRWEQDQ
ncbi:MAG: MmgE/PrpD family protein, partial [Candidatus Tectomicrobia bacterium]|nr:MmgE/PrpD family protein [Candidatus Tectomicrobia bacterium]